MIQVCLSFVYRNTTDHCVLLLYPATLLRDLSARDIFWWYVYVFFCKKLYHGKKHTYFALFYWYLFALLWLSFCSKQDFNDHIFGNYPFYILYVICFNFLSLQVEVGVAQLYTVFVMLRCVPLFWTFIMKNIEQGQSLFGI